MRWIVHARGPMTRSAVLTCFSSFAFFTPHSPGLLLFLPLSAFFSPIYSSLFQLFHTCPRLCCCCVLHLAHFHPFASVLIHTSFPFLPPPPASLAFSPLKHIGSRDRDDFISKGTNPSRVMGLQDRGDNSSGLVMHRAAEYMDVK